MDHAEDAVGLAIEDLFMSDLHAAVGRNGMTASTFCLVGTSQTASTS